jgi:hypothetical protein
VAAGPGGSYAGPAWYARITPAGVAAASFQLYSANNQATPAFGIDQSDNGDVGVLVAGSPHTMFYRLKGDGVIGSASLADYWQNYYLMRDAFCAEAGGAFAAWIHRQWQSTPVGGALYRISAGNTVTFKEIGDNDVVAMASRKDGYLWVLDSGAAGAAHIYRFDASNNYTAVSSFWVPGCSALRCVRHLALVADGTMAVLGESQGPLPAGGTKQQMLFYRFSAAGAELSRRWYDNGTDLNVAGKVQPQADGGFLLVGYARRSGCASGSLGYPWLVRTDANANLLWSKLITGHDRCAAPVRAVPLADGSQMLVGNDTDPVGTPRAWLARLDPWGNLTCTPTCQGLPVAACDDGNPCTADLCDPVKGCTYALHPDGTGCGASGTCKAGLCL